MKREIKKSSGLFDKKLNLILDPNMKELPLSGSLARKVEEAIEKWSKVKDVNDVIRRPANESSPKK